MSAPIQPALQAWLDGLGLGQYGAVLAEHDITLDLLLGMSDADLEKCGIQSFGHRRRLLEAVREQPIAPAAKRPVAVPPQTAVPPKVAAVPRAAPAPRVAVEAVSPAQVTPASGERPQRSVWAKVLASKFLLISIGVHLLFGIGATVYVVQQFQANRKLTFKGGPPTTNPSKRAMEHKVSMAKKKNSMSAPAQAKRITTSGLSKMALPEMPALPTATTVTANKMAGMGGVGVGFGPAGGMGGGGLGGGGGGSIPFFGFRDNRGGGALTGYLYDLKQAKDHKPTNMEPGRYQGIVKEFVAKGWDEKAFDPYFKSPKPLYTTQIFIPDMSADEAPKAYDVDRGPHKVEPKMWIALYKGKVTAPVAGRFRFVGFADDILVVRFNSQNVLDAGCQNIAPVPRGEKYVYKDFIKEEGRQGFYDSFGSIRGAWFTVEAGKQYDVEILVGEQPGGFFCAHLLIEQEGVAYKKDPKSDLPRLPIFQLAAGKPGKTQNLPPFAPEGGPIWKGTSPIPTAVSPLDALKAKAAAAAAQ